MVWIILSIAILLIIIGLLIVFIAMKKYKNHKTDYYNFFWIGIVWVVIGIIANDSFFWIIGLVFAVIGLINRKKWKENHRTWKQLSKSEKKFKIWVMVILAIIVIIGGVVLFITENKNIDKNKAIEIALRSECINEGELTDNVYYNDNTDTWWIDMNAEKEGCSPACVVYENGNAEVNWRCTGLIE